MTDLTRQSPSIMAWTENGTGSSEDVKDFERGRIRALQEERLYIQKKTFTKWMNSFLQKAKMEVEDLFIDLGDGRKLLKLLEIISGDIFIYILYNTALPVLCDV